MQGRDLPPAEFLVKAKKNLAAPGPDAAPTQMCVDAAPRGGLFMVTFVPRRYSNGTWEWEIGSSKRFDSV